MLQNISWHTCLVTTTILLVLYYVVISMIFYTSAVKQFFNGKMKKRENQVKDEKDEQS